jgi:WD40 repeat protein
LWDGEGKPLATLQGHTGPVYRAVFSPDGLRILTASYDNTARLWDVEGKLLAIFPGHTGIIWQAVFSPDGRRVLTASDDHTAQIWDSDGTQLVSLRGHAHLVWRAMFSPDGRRILTASFDNTARLWEVAFSPTQELVNITKAEVPRCLTPEQRQHHFLPPDPPAWCYTLQKWPYDTEPPPVPTPTSAPQ